MIKNMYKAMIASLLFMTVLVSISGYPYAVCAVKLFGFAICMTSAYQGIFAKKNAKQASDDDYISDNNAFCAR